VAGLLLALALQSAYEDTLPLPHRLLTAPRQPGLVRALDFTRLKTLSPSPIDANYRTRCSPLCARPLSSALTLMTSS
ncbi:MAG TPA: hypothetical protein VFI62_09155, partial [Burkholderiales bacterium]|nr:hypothetical protein [Burkholderiales bacterium]